MAKKVKNHNTGDALWVKKEYEFLKDAVALKLGSKEAANIFRLEFPRKATPKLLGRRMSIWRNYKGSWEDFLSSNLKLNGSNYNYWHPPEVQVLLESVKKGLDRNEILSALEKETGFWRSYPSLDNKLQRLKEDPKNKEYFINWRTRTSREGSEISSYPIHRDRKLKYIPKVFKSKGVKYPLICINGHECMVEPANWSRGCSECQTKFFNIDFDDMVTPALVYAVWIGIIEAIKPGFTRIKEGQTPEEAIKERFEQHSMPYDYNILAYDVSVEGIAGRHEKHILKNTKEWQYWDQPQGWGGWTEVRTKEAFHDILCEYETVLDIVFKIKV